MFTRTRVTTAALTALVAVSLYARADENRVAASGEAVDGSVAAGRYLVVIAGCNDCHTAGWMDSGGKVVDSDWLLGTPVGFRGPWGTTYPSNLRLTAASIDEDAWVTMLKHRNARPPMPWFNTAQMTDADARNIYRFLRSLGPAGERAPLPVDPGVEPATPYILFEPLHLERLQSASTPGAAE